MIGTILSYDIQAGKGLISAANENRYEFEIQSWVSKTKHPCVGDEIDFKLEENKVLDIYYLEKSNQSLTIEQKETSTAAIISLVFGIIGITATWWLFAIPSIIAIIAGHIAKSNINDSNNNLAGRGLATAGLVLGYIVLLIYLSLATAFVGILNI